MVGPFTTMATWVLLQVNVEINFPLFKCFLLSEFITNDWRRQCSCPGMCAIFRPALLQSSISAAQKIKKLSETPTTVPIVAKLCFINCKNKKNTKRFVQPFTPGGYPKRPFYNVKMNEKWPILNIM